MIRGFKDAERVARVINTQATELIPTKPSLGT